MLVLRETGCGVQENSTYMLNFSVNLKLFQKKKFI